MREEEGLAEVSSKLLKSIVAGGSLFFLFIAT